MPDTDPQLRATRQLRSLLLAVLVSLAIVVVAPFLFHAAFGFPLFSVRSWLVASAVTFVFAVPAFWVAFSHRADFTGRLALTVLSIILAAAAYVAWRFR